MIQIWIEDGSGARLGPGPITSATGWDQGLAVDRAGSFSFAMPADDPRRSLIRTFRTARCWLLEEGRAPRCVGAGRIERIRTVLGPDGVRMLEVSGPDLLGELRDRQARGQQLWETVLVHPVRLYWHRPTGADTVIARCYDFAPGDTSSYETISLGESNYDGSQFEAIRVRAPWRFERIIITLRAGGAKNTNTAELRAKYYASDGTYKELTLATDGTATDYPLGHTTLDKSGHVTFSAPADMAQMGGANFEVQLYTVGITTDVDIADIALWRTQPVNDALAPIMAYAPAGWSVDALNGYSEVASRVRSGTELMTNGSFAAFTGTAGDATSDVFTAWNPVYVDDGAGKKALAVTHEGTTAVKLVTGATDVDYCGLLQFQTVTPATEYTLRMRWAGDGTGQGAVKIFQSLPGYEDITEAIDVQITGTAFDDWEVVFTTPASCTYIGIYVLSPLTAGRYAIVTGVSLQTGGGKSVYLTMQNETVLQAAIRIAEATGQHFIASPGFGRQLLWLGYDQRDNGLRAVAEAEAIGAEGRDELVLISELEELEDAAELVSRVYASGSGTGEEQLTIADATLVPPAGYVLNATDGYVERTAAAGAIGRIECSQAWSDIVPQNDGIDQRREAANMLVMQMVAYLQRHSCSSTDPSTGDVPKFYRAKVAKANRILLPGFRMRVRYVEYREGAAAIALNTTMWILEANFRVGVDDVAMTDLVVATVDRQPLTTMELLLRDMRQLRGVQWHTSAPGC